MIIIDLNDCGITYEVDQNPNILPDEAIERIIPNLTKEKRVLVLSAESSEAFNGYLSNSHLKS